MKVELRTSTNCFAHQPRASPTNCLLCPSRGFQNASAKSARISTSRLPCLPSPVRGFLDTSALPARPRRGFQNDSAGSARISTSRLLCPALQEASKMLGSKARAFRLAALPVGPARGFENASAGSARILTSRLTALPALPCKRLPKCCGRKRWHLEEPLPVLALLCLLCLAMQEASKML